MFEGDACRTVTVSTLRESGELTNIKEIFLHDSFYCRSNP
jgi:hypothetical protein